MSPVRPVFILIGRRLDPEHHRLRDLLTRVAQPFEWIEAGTPAAQKVLAERGLADPELPVVVETEDIVEGATVERLVEEWEMTAPPASREYDLAIVGAGPAGLAAAVYAASDGLSTIVLERDVPGGQASHTSKMRTSSASPAASAAPSWPASPGARRRASEPSSCCCARDDG